MKLFLSALTLIMMEPGAALRDPQEEARAQDLMREIRCVACENEPISQSGADIASDMRDRVRSLVAEGKSDAEVRDWFVDRYGEFVLFRPDSEGLSGKLLWGLPFVFLVFGGVILWLRRPRSDTNRISPIAPGHEEDTAL